MKTSRAYVQHRLEEIRRHEAALIELRRRPLLAPPRRILLVGRGR